MENALKLKSILFAAVAACLLVTPALDAHPNPGKELLDAAKTGKVEVVEHLLEMGVDVNTEDQLGNTALIYASKVGDSPTIDMLLTHKADVNKQNSAGATPLMLAAKYGHEHIISKLIDRGANPLITNNNGATAAVLAKAYGHRSLYYLLKKAERKADTIS